MLSLPIFRGTVLTFGVLFFYLTKSKIVLLSDEMKNRKKAKLVFARRNYKETNRKIEISKIGSPRFTDFQLLQTLQRLLRRRSQESTFGSSIFSSAANVII